MGTAWNKIHWTDSMLDFLKENVDKMSNRELSKALGIGKSLTCMKIYELGLKRCEVERWSPQQVKMLLENYKQFGNTELLEMFTEKFPEKKWTYKMIESKLRKMNLSRTEKEQLIIAQRNGIKSHQDLSDNYVASKLAHGKSKLKEKLLRHLALIELKRQQLKLQRELLKND